MPTAASSPSGNGGADPTKVVFFLDGGGACLDADDVRVHRSRRVAVLQLEHLGEDPPSAGGIFDLADPDNPFADYSFVYVPYCTGDVHLGDVTPGVLAGADRRAQRLRQRHGGVDLPRRALSRCRPGRRRRQDRRVGRRPGLRRPRRRPASRRPGHRVRRQSGAYPDDPDLNAEILGEQWGAYDDDARLGGQRRPDRADWGPPRFWIQAGLHDPDIVLARFDFAYDDGAERASMERSELDTTTSSARSTPTRRRSRTPACVLHSYTAPGHDHGIVERPTSSTTLEVNGVRLVDWVAALIAGEPLDDVHCTECEEG